MSYREQVGMEAPIARYWIRSMLVYQDNDGVEVLIWVYRRITRLDIMALALAI